MGPETTLVTAAIVTAPSGGPGAFRTEDEIVGAFLRATEKTQRHERQRGRHISGVAHDGGEIAWNFHRKRSLEI
jgi:hypothetical protein